MPFISVLGKHTFFEEKVPDQVLSEPTQAQEGRPALLLVHGAGGSGSKWRHQLAGLTGHHVIALDLPAHGRSEGEASGSIASYREFCREFARNFGLKKFVFAGHSMGGAIALDFALTYPEMLAGLVLVDSGSKLRVNPEIMKALALGEYPLGSVKFQYADDVPPELLEEATGEIKTVPAVVYLADFQACDSFNLMDQVKNIDLPTLIICGQDDQMTPVKYSEYLKKEIPNSNLVLIPNAGHMAMVEHYELVNKAIGDFLSSL